MNANEHEKNVLDQNITRATLVISVLEGVLGGALFLGAHALAKKFRLPYTTLMTMAVCAVGVSFLMGMLMSWIRESSLYDKHGRPLGPGLGVDEIPWATNGVFYALMAVMGGVTVGWALGPKTGFISACAALISFVLGNLFAAWKREKREREEGLRT